MSCNENLVLVWFSHILQREKPPLTRSDSGNSEDNYVPMNPGSSTSPLNAALADSPKNNYIPMSPGPHHFDFPGFSATLPARKGSTASMCYRPGRVSDVTPPPINRNLKPNRKGEGCVLIISDYWWPRVYSYGLSASKGSRVEHDQSIQISGYLFCYI